jgi:ABC-2 type transport system permease protein
VATDDSLSPALAPFSALSPADEARVFRRLRGRLLGNTVGVFLSSSRLRLGLMLVFSSSFWIGLFLLFSEAFTFLNRHIPIHNEVVAYLFSLFFGSLMLMLVLSSGIILYSALYRSREAQFLLTTPATPDRIFAHKVQEAVMFSSWGFLLLGSPMLVAYGAAVLAPWYFYALFFVFLLCFLFIPASLGAIACLLLTFYFPRSQKHLLAAVAVLTIAPATWLLARTFGSGGEAILSESWMSQLMARLQFTQAPLLPSWWLSEGLRSVAAGKWEESFFYLLLIVSNASFLFLAATAVASHVYRTSYSRSWTGRSTRRAAMVRWWDTALSRSLFFLPVSLRLLIVKDVRTFRRDPSQWSQFLIFFGLLALYYLNIRRLGYNVTNGHWRSVVSLLNLSVTSLILSTFTTRFIFPLLSLEGRRFWVLGLSPLERHDILIGKFVFAAGGSLLPTVALVCLSDVMLEIPHSITLLHVVTVLLLCLGLAGISVGLGARLPILREDNPSKIAAGFGGTLNLLVSMVFILAMILLLALPGHIYLAMSQTQYATQTINLHALRPWLIAGMGASVVVAAAAAVVPMHLGIRHLRRMEF